MRSQIEQLWSQAQCHIAAKQAAPARAALEALLVADPNHTLARLALCNLAWRQDRVREATDHALRAARSLPDYPELICETVGVLLRVGETVAARECLRRPVLDGTMSDTLLIRLADYWHALGEHTEALAQADRARLLGFDGDGVRFRRGRELACLARMDEAEPELELGFLLGQTQGEIALELGRLRTQTRERNHLNTLAGGLKSVTRGSRDHAALEFALYKELEDIGRYDDAWQALVRANGTMAQRKRCDVERMRRWFDLCIALCTREALIPAQTEYDGPQPIFIVGLPHSGTELLAQLLADHPDVTNAGELTDFEKQLRWAADHRTTQDERFLERVPVLDFGEIGRRYLERTQWRAHGRPWFIDSQPDNWMYVGLIRAALPHARIVHVTADPMDVCFANFRAWFGDSHEYTYDLIALHVHYQRYLHLMTLWHTQIPILKVNHNDLVLESDRVEQRVLEFCGERAGRAGVDSRSVPPSSMKVAHVRRPACAESHGQWQRYAQHLRKLSTALADLASSRAAG